jgi:hypothetical protein
VVSDHNLIAVPAIAAVLEPSPFPRLIFPDYLFHLSRGLDDGGIERVDGGELWG